MTSPATRITSPEGLTLAELRPLHELVDVARFVPLSRAEKLCVIAQAVLLFEQLYAHLPLKMNEYAVNPIQEFKELKAHLDALSDLGFHRRVIEIVTRFHDRHTMYMLTRLKDAAAKLPFTLQRCYDQGRIVYVVTEVKSQSGPNPFTKGVEVTHWNGTPIARAVELNGEQLVGGNPAARRAVGELFLTQRPLRFCLPPDEEWVRLTFVATDGHLQEIQFPWSGVVVDAAAVPAPVRSASGRMSLGLDEMLWSANQVRRVLFAPSSFDHERRVAHLRALWEDKLQSPSAELRTTSILPNFEFRPVQTPDGTFGYIWIKDFVVTDDPQGPRLFLSEFVRILGLLPQDGLIIDIRCNPGGIIAAGQIILQTLTPRRIRPGRFHFRNTVLTRDMCNQNFLFANWAPSVSQAVETGAVYSQGFPIDRFTDEDYNRIGQQYYGPVVVITSALSYSTSDIFAADYQDHEIGKILGIDPNMGAGGANNWDHGTIRKICPGFYLPLPLEADLPPVKPGEQTTGEVTAPLREAFEERGVILTDHATTITGFIDPDGDGKVWVIPDRGHTYTIRRIDWLNDKLNVYYEGDPSPVQDLPDGVSFGFAARMSTRTGRHSGLPLEDLGVVPDEIHYMTKNDVLGSSEDLIVHAGHILAGMPAYHLSVVLQRTGGKKLTAAVTTKNADRLDLLVDGRPRQTFDVHDGATTIDLTTLAGPTSDLEFHAFQAGLLVALRHIKLSGEKGVVRNGIDLSPQVRL